MMRLLTALSASATTKLNACVVSSSICQSPGFGMSFRWQTICHDGRITRALTDLALAQSERQSIRFYAMSAAILADREGYYAQLETAQKMRAVTAPLDLTPWLHWFLATLLCAIAGLENFSLSRDDDDKPARDDNLDADSFFNLPDADDEDDDDN